MQQREINSNNTINDREATIMKPVDGVDDYGSGSSGSGGGGGGSSSASTGRTFTLSFNIRDASGNTATIGSIQLSLTYTDIYGQTKTVSTERYTGVGGFKYNVLQITTSKEYQDTDIYLTVYVNGSQKYSETTEFSSNGLAWSTNDKNRFSSYILYITVPSVEQGIILPSIYRPFYTQGTILITSGNTGNIKFAIANGITYQEADGNFYLGDTTLMVDGKTITANKSWIIENAINNGDDSGIIGEYDTSDLPSNSFQVQWVEVDKLNRGEIDQTVSDCPLYGGYYGFQLSYRTSSVFSPKDVIATVKYKFATDNFSYGAIEGGVATAAAEKLRATSPGSTTATCNINRSPSWHPITASTSEDRTWTVIGIDSITASTVSGYTVAIERSNDGGIVTYTKISESGSGSSGGSGSDEGEVTVDNNNLFRGENELYENAVITCGHEIYSDTNKFDGNRAHSCRIEVTEGSPAGYSGTLMSKTISAYNSNARFYESIKVNGKVGTMKEEVTVQDDNGATTSVTITHTTFVCDIAGKTNGVRYFAIPLSSIGLFSEKASKITPLDYAYENSDTWHSIHTKIGEYFLYQRELVEYYDSSLKSNQIRVKTVSDIADLKNGSVAIIGISDAFTALDGNGIESGNEYYNECKNPYTEVVPHTSFISFIKMY